MPGSVIAVTSAVILLIHQNTTEGSLEFIIETLI